MSLFQRVLPTLDGLSLALGDGAVRQHLLRFDLGTYPTPFWVEADGDPTKVFKIDLLPFTLCLMAGSIGVTSSAPAGTGTVASFTAINADTIAAAGGETLIATVSGISGTLGNPTINGVACTGVTTVDATHVSFVTPAGITVGGPYDVVLGGKTLAASVTVGAIITTTFASGLLDGTRGTWPLTDNWISGAGGSHAFSTDHILGSAPSSLKIMIASGGGDSQLHYGFADNRPLLEPSGVFLQFYLWVPDATVAALTAAGGNQQKFHLMRKDVNTNPPSFGMLGLGSAFAGNKLTLVRDAGTSTAYTSTFAMGDAAGWVRAVMGMNRKAGAGSLTLWLNNFKVFSETLATYGSDVTTDLFYPRVGSAFCQVASPISTYFGGASLTNGFPAMAA